MAFSLQYGICLYMRNLLFHSTNLILTFLLLFPPDLCYTMSVEFGIAPAVLAPVSVAALARAFSLCCRDLLHLRTSEESRFVYSAVSLTSPDQPYTKQRPAAVEHFISELFPTAPCVRLLADSCCRFGVFNPLSVDFLCFC